MAITREEIMHRPRFTGYVYLIKCGMHYKIGRTKDLSGRVSQLSIQLPHKPKVIMTYPSANPVGAEDFWHNKFHDKRLNGEWFELEIADLEQFASCVNEVLLDMISVCSSFHQVVNE